MASALFMFAAAMTSTIDPGGHGHVTLVGPAIRVGDVIGGLPARTAGIEIAKLPTGRSSVTLSHVALAALVRRAVPGLAVGDGPVSVTFRRSVVANDDRTCFVARSAIGIGETIDPGKLVATPCEAGAVAAVRYDRRSGASIAARPIAAGESVGGALPIRLVPIAPGSVLTLVSRSGPVTVVRPVTALQAGETGGRVFVRSGDGEVFAIPVVGDAS